MSRIRKITIPFSVSILIILLVVASGYGFFTLSNSIVLDDFDEEQETVSEYEILPLNLECTSFENGEIENNFGYLSFSYPSLLSLDSGEDLSFCNVELRHGRSFLTISYNVPTDESFGFASDIVTLNTSSIVRERFDPNHSFHDIEYNTYNLQYGTYEVGDTSCADTIDPTSSFIPLCGVSPQMDSINVSITAILPDSTSQAEGEYILSLFDEVVASLSWGKR
ncbi:hypothetical protein KC717_01315 [Candidatus Dojkabacteria bacterium]|uniref:Uncharacterized protein n=1 Tax=Candidatus Dojkabacteria bacterium TaxID=2099670 RepID=A0A955L791_9BACT|nr:hypothetical protein [Candidatus Dojkabacteria bacterium]